MTYPYKYPCYLYNKHHPFLPSDPLYHLASAPITACLYSIELPLPGAFKKKEKRKEKRYCSFNLQNNGLNLTKS